MRAMSRTLVAVMIVVLGARTGRAQGPNLRVQRPGVEGVVLLDSIARRLQLTAPVERMLTAIHEAFGEYGIKADAIEPAAGRLPSRRVNLSRRIGKTPMSR